MTTQHTPGPWTTNKNIGRKGELGIVADAAPCIIAIMGNQKAWPAEAKANAQLIAAAPDLLEALRAMLRHYAPMALESEAWVADAVLRCAIAAIAKADGR